MKIKELFAVIVLYRCNFQVLHWNSAGENFNDSHVEISKKYYQDLDDTMDTIAEMLVRLGENPMNIKEVLDFVSEGEKTYLLVESTKLYGRNAIVKDADIMLTDICNLLAETIQDGIMQEPINAGMRSELETILNQYDLEARFLNKRKLAPETEYDNQIGGSVPSDSVEVDADVDVESEPEAEEPEEVSDEELENTEDVEAAPEESEEETEEDDDLSEAALLRNIRRK